MKLLLLLLCLLMPAQAFAQDRNFTLSAPAEIVQTGMLQHLLPRFSLKHEVRITTVESGGDVVIGTQGTPVFSGLGTVWHLSGSDDAGPSLFRDWLLSDIGQRALASYQPDGEPLFTPPAAEDVPLIEVSLDGDPVVGQALSLQHCGRCHVVHESNRMDGMGQAPSFAGLRALPDWENRFAIFYALNPHPSFTQVAGITPPFPANLPPAIIPVEITEDDMDDILAYAATRAPADLGAPIQSQ